MTRKALLLAAATIAVTAPASATTLVTSLAAFQAGAAGAITRTANPGSYDLTQFILPTTTTIALNDGARLDLSTAAQVAAPQNGFPYLLADGFSGALFIPTDALGNQVGSETIRFGAGVSALGFEIAPFSAATGFPATGFPGGPYNVTVTLANGQTSTVSLPGGSFDTGTTLSQFFGFYGGGVTSLTISTSDPNGFAFGNFVDVPEPASATLLLVGVAGLLARRRAVSA